MHSNLVLVHVYNNGFITLTNSPVLPIILLHKNESSSNFLERRYQVLQNSPRAQWFAITIPFANRAKIKEFEEMHFLYIDIAYARWVCICVFESLSLWFVLVWICALGQGIKKIKALRQESEGDETSSIQISWMKKFCPSLKKSFRN